MTSTVRTWLEDDPDGAVAELEIDYTDVDYSWGDGPVSSIVSFVDNGVANVA